MTIVKAFVHQFLGNAIDGQKLTPEEIALVYNMDEETTARIIEYTKEIHKRNQI